MAHHFGLCTHVRINWYDKWYGMENCSGWYGMYAKVKFLSMIAKYH